MSITNDKIQREGKSKKDQRCGNGARPTKRFGTMLIDFKNESSWPDTGGGRETARGMRRALRRKRRGGKA